MKKNNLIASSAAAFVALVAIGGIAASTYAYQGNPDVHGPNYTPERHETMEKAFESNDYNAWLKARGDIKRGRMMDIVNEENFSQFAQMHEAMEDGDIEKAQEIREELGLGRGGRGCPMLNDGEENERFERRGSGRRGGMGNFSNRQSR